MARLILLLIFNGFISLKVCAQSNDFQIWTGLSLEKEINKKISFEWGSQWRFVNNGHELGAWLNQAEFTYKVNKWAGLFAHLRYGTSSITDDWRYGVGFALDKNFGEIKLAIKTQMQFNQDALGFDLLDKDWQKLLRSKLKVSHKINKKTEVDISVEPIFNLKDQNPVLRRWRSGASISRRLKKKIYLDLTYYQQDRFSKAAHFQSTDHIISIDFKYQF